MEIESIDAFVLSHMLKVCCQNEIFLLYKGGFFAKLIAIYLYKYINGRTDVCLSVCWYVEGQWNANPCTDRDEILHPHPHLSKEGFGAGLSPAPSPFRA